MNSVVFFDGECNFCNGSVNFIIKHDKKEHFRFLSLQNPKAKELLKKEIDLKTIYLLENGVVYERSTAALKIAKKLNSPINLLYTFIIVPAFIRDFVYDLVSKNRYLISGKTEACVLPTERTRKLFL